MSALLLFVYFISYAVAVPCESVARLDPHWVCQNSTLVPDDSSITVSCPVISDRGAAFGEHPRLDSRLYVKTCDVAKACVQVHQSPESPEYHLNVAEIIMDTADCTRPCDWTCIGGRDLQIAINHTRMAHVLATQAPLLRRIREMAQKQTTLINQPHGYGQSEIWPHAYPSRVAPPGRKKIADVLTASNADLLAMTPYHRLLVDDDEVGALPVSEIETVRPTRRIVLPSGAEVASYHVADFLPGMFTKGRSDPGLENFNAKLVAAALATHRLHQTHDPDSVTAHPTQQNLMSFSWQDKAFYAENFEKECKWGSAVKELTECTEYRALLNALVRAAVNFENMHKAESNRSIGFDERQKWGPACTPGPLTVDGDPLYSYSFKDIGVSASVKTQGAGHPHHYHNSASTTGVYYAQIPKGSGDIVMDDLNKSLRFTPQPGQILIFPGWLSHTALANEFALNTSHRVSYPFDLRGLWWHLPKAALPKDEL